MVGVIAVRTGEIWLAHLDPTVGHEQGGRRPVVVVSSDGCERITAEYLSHHLT